MRFMIEWTYGPQEHYRPVGVWVDDGANMTVAFTSPVASGGHARDVMARMQGEAVIPRDFLEFHVTDTLPPQMGDRGPIYDTDRYKTVAQCADAVVRHIRESWDNDARRWTKDLAVLT